MLGLIWSLLPVSARAQEVGQVRTYLLSTQRLYEDLEYERALEELALARRFSRSSADAVTISLYEGLILANLGKKDESLKAFRAALLLRPEATLPMKVSPKVQQQFEAIREQVVGELAKQKAELPAAQLKPEPRKPPVVKRGNERGEQVKREKARQEAKRLVAKAKPEAQGPSADEKTPQEKPSREPVAQLEPADTKPAQDMPAHEPVAQSGADDVSLPQNRPGREQVSQVELIGTRPMQDVPLREPLVQFKPGEVEPSTDIPAREPAALGRTAEFVPILPFVPVPHTEKEPAAPMAGEHASRGLRSQAWVPATAGGVLLLAGGGSWLMAKQEEAKFANNDPRLVSQVEVDATSSRGRTWQSVGGILAGAGVLALGIAVGMYEFGAPGNPEGVKRGASADGTSAHMTGRWP